MHARRVVTGHDDSGRSIFVSDEEVEGLTQDLFPGWEFHRLWGADETPTLPRSGCEPDWTTYFPAVGGLRLSFSTIPPQDLEPPDDLDVQAAELQTERDMSGLLAHMDRADPGMHTTDTIDLEVMLQGEVILELDDGEQRLLKPGDTIVQNGTRHRWRNPGSEPAVMAIFMLGAHRAAR